MTSAWKLSIRKALRRIGYDVIPYRADVTPAAQLAALLRHHRVDVVLDVGANTGQFGASLRGEGFRGRIESFEPQSAAYTALAARAARDSQWGVHNFGLGAETARATLNIAGNSYSSSVLPMLEQHLESAPESAYVGTEAVELRRLDDIFDSLLSGASRPFLKVDVQGYEAQVLAGATASLPRLVGMQLESSVVPLYEGEELFVDMLVRTRDLGFSLAAVAPNFTNLTTGQLLSLDSVLFRPAGS